MALVAYSDDSDLSSDSEDIVEHVNGIKGETKPKITPEVIKEETPPEVLSRSSPVVKENPKLFSTVNDIVEDNEGDAIDKPSILASIPAALPVDSTQDADEIGEVEDELTDVPTVDTWKVTAEIKKGGSDGKPQAKSLIKKKEKSKVKFFVPALSEFDDDDEEEEPKEEPERKKLKPSSKGTGLFSVLPEPKHLSVKETKRSLIPHILTKPPSVQKPPKPKPALEKKPIIQSNDSDEEQDSGPSDFFSLSEFPVDIGAVPETHIPALKEPVMDVQTSSKHLPEAAAVVEDARHASSEQMPTEYASNPQNEESVYPFQGQETHSGNSSDMDQEAMIRLMGKRRRKGEEINFIDVNADDALLTRDEWMTKALSEEKPSYSFSKKREGLPSQKQKQKHQITFLAHQAKERELELKNNWAQNRMTKMQTQAKYGF